MRIEIHAIDRDNDHGAYDRRLSFGGLGAARRDITNHLGLVEAQDTDGGYVGTIEVPDGSEVYRDEDGLELLTLPGRSPITPDEAWGLAVEGYPGLAVAREPARA